MKRKTHLRYFYPITITVVFAISAILTSKIDDSGMFVWVPVAGVICGLIMLMYEGIKDSNKSAINERQEEYSTKITHDSSFGNGNLTLYFDSSRQMVTICQATTTGTNEKIVENFVHLNSVETDEHIVSLDALNHKVLMVKSSGCDTIILEKCCINEKLQKLGINIKPSTPTLKSYNDYAFITDDENEYVAIVTPSAFHVHRYSDIVSISYEENGTDVFNKSIGGAVAGGLLLGGVGAMVGGSTAKATQNKEVSAMSVKILLKSTSDSTIILPIYKGAPLNTKDFEDKELYEGLRKEVSSIKDIFSIIIDIVDKKNVNQRSIPSTPISVADELAKLAKLKELGVLTEEEFRMQKEKLLNSGV